MRSVPPSPDPGDEKELTGKEVTLLLDIAREQMNETFKLAEGFDSKARGVMQSATVFFAASQAATAVLLTSTKASALPGWVPVTAAVIAILSLLAIGTAAVKTVRLQEPTNAKAVNVDSLTGSLLHYAERDDRRVSRYMLKEIANIVRDRRNRNDGERNAEGKLVARGKAQRLTTITWFAYAAVACSAAQLLLTIVVSYFKL